jgi:hypothetical protein
MQWVQSANSNDLFDTVFIKCNPGYLGQIAPLLILSTGAVVTTSLQENLVERLAWLEAVLRNIDPNVSCGAIQIIAVLTILAGSRSS